MKVVIQVTTYQESRVSIAVGVLFTVIFMKAMYFFNKAGIKYHTAAMVVSCGFIHCTT